MAKHAIKDGRAVCLEPLDADCRAVWDCGCERFHGLEQQPDGTWTHDGRWDDELDDYAPCRSRLQAAPKWCNVVEWIECQGIFDCWDLGDEYSGAWSHYDVDLPDGPIAYEWGDEWLTWEYADTKVLGAFIGRYVVAQWADEMDLSA
jgi:hypothetical protein